MAVGVFVLTIVFLLIVGMVLPEITQPSTDGIIHRARVELEDRVNGFFYRKGPTLPLLGGSVDLERALHELSAIPDAYLPLLTHLQPIELVGFLAYDDGVRAQMLATHPPRASQRLFSMRVLSSTKTTAARVLSAFRQRFSSWTSSSSGVVSLDKTISALSQSRAEKRQAEVLAPSSHTSKQHPH